MARGQAVRRSADGRLLRSERSRKLIARSGVTAKLRPVMPMMMRGVSAPVAKQRYIVMDAARQARARGVPFGRIVDPFGEPVRRAFAMTDQNSLPRLHDIRALDRSSSNSVWAIAYPLSWKLAVTALIHSSSQRSSNRPFSSVRFRAACQATHRRRHTARPKGCLKEEW
jgi:hypothetical protein